MFSVFTRCLLTLPMLLVTAMAQSCFAANIEDWKAAIESTKEVMAEAPDTYVQFNGLLDAFISTAEAVDENCFFGGYESVRSETGCTAPTARCADQSFKCNPLLFGDNLCVDIGSRRQRNTVFAQCENQFRTQKKANPYDFLAKILADEKQKADLQKLINSVADTCSRGRQSSTRMCDLLKERVAKIKNQMPAGQTVETKKFGSDYSAAGPATVANTAASKTAVNANTGGVKTNGTASNCVECNSYVAKPPIPAMVSETNKALKPYVEQQSLSELNRERDQVVAQIRKLLPESADLPPGKGPNPMLALEYKSTKGPVFSLSKKRACLELKIFQLNNPSSSNFSVDCSHEPYVMPKVRMQFLKLAGSADYDQSIQAHLAKEIADYKRRMGSTTSADDRLYFYQNMECFQNYPSTSGCVPAALKNLNAAIDGASRFKSQLSYLIEDNDGKLVPFKVVAAVDAQTKPGPKIRQGDFFVPEGSFNLSTTSQAKKDPCGSTYYVSTKIDFESWSKQSDQLSSLPEGEKNPGGGGILIHGTGGSDGCLSLSNAESAYMAGIVQNNLDRGVSSAIDIYPLALTSDSINSLTKSSRLAKYREFWTKLQKTYDANAARTVSGVKTVDQIFTK